MTAETTAETAYAKLVALLDGGGARYELIDHPPEGRTDLVSPLRGNELSQAAKCIVVMVKLGKKAKRHVLAVVPGDARVDLNALKRLLAGSASGTILPFSFHPELTLIADPGLLAHQRIFFNAARLDRSVALDTDDYLALARPRVEPIAATAPAV